MIVISGATGELGRHILYTSHQGANPSSAFAPGRDHAATEALLQSSGVSYVSLRNGFYAESALFQLGGVKQRRPWHSSIQAFSMGSRHH